MITRLVIVALALALALGGAGAQGIVEMADCITRPAGHIVRCGYVTLPQDYADPAGSKVGIYFTQIQSRGAAPQPDPLVYLVGGPGSSGTQLLQVSFDKYLRAFAGDRDIIVIDQRGTGMSNPPLYCREALIRLDEILQSHHADYAELVLEILTDCHRRLSTKGVKFDAFHSENIARDVVNVMLSLGYEKWNLVGVSYGSRLALTMMRDYPHYLRSVILDSVYPPQADIYLDAYYNGERALDALFAACAADAYCSARYPDFEAQFYRLYHQLNHAPLRVRHQQRGYPDLSIVISGFRLYDWVFNWLYTVDSIRLIPRLVHDLARGHSQDPVRFGVMYDAAMTSLSLGMHYTVQCQEEYVSTQVRDYAGMLSEHPHLADYLHYPVEGAASLPRLCELWQAKARPALANEPVTSDIPALLLSGNLDPITPPSFADLARETLSAAYSFVLPHVGHGTLRSDPCAVHIARAFIAEPLSEPDSDCIAQTRPIDFD